jgi:hypothetical protein
LEQPGSIGDLIDLDLLAGTVDPVGEYLHFVRGGGVVERDAQQESVELRLGQRVGALVLDRVRRRHDVERGVQGERAALDRHLPFLHRLE